MALPLDGVRVLDFTRVLAGPFCTMLLADLGAEVIKIENPAGGDETRQWGPPWAGSGEQRHSAYYLAVNRNKRSLTLNLKTAAGRALARRLVPHSHVIIENFTPGHMAAFGLGYDEVQPLNPALVYCSLTGYGQTGPYSPRPGYDYVIQAMSGLMSITGATDGPPVKVGVAIADVICGLYAASGIQAALRHAEHTGQGQRLDIALLETQLAALVNVASNYLISGTDPARYGNQHPSIVPYQTFMAADGAFVLAVGNDGQFARLCALLERRDWLADARFATNPARVQHREALATHLAEIFATRPVADWVDALLAAGIPAGPIHTVAQALNDPHVLARGMVQTLPLTASDSFRMVASPLKLSATPPRADLPPPALGEHTAALLRDLCGVDAATLAQYRAEGVV
ncbi:MAG: CoA transferase [Anaerolineae bacterium]|nr:CoA transferase [Anaerolineae bacterium]